MKIDRFLGLDLRLGEVAPGTLAAASNLFVDGRRRHVRQATTNIQWSHT
jgi:hypothetical protein